MREREVSKILGLRIVFCKKKVKVRYKCIVISKKL
ncbi:hypothetical protein FUSO6_07630 [Fusobacterium necrophorum DAB]|uniref:Uncharacterized protein n=2 Tax=Fusobacterium necrophorum TaxID=859 RepID=A0AB73BT73_9FUSO|nr:hypothetical protein FUSO3_11885 [Fusobacterium necrophorum BL]KDE66260.1 hypothetical protein FUSO5_02805 [Fusobacterium necrophorum BFTR-1]KDE68901.1 hypothetical protein FUSO6_07630 [Fusobacterium necrophorum DAB]KDE69027.1 hypothetical protein FUSO8_12275 [Fusobacterium necrophorum DJ-2]